MSESPAHLALVPLEYPRHHIQVELYIQWHPSGRRTSSRPHVALRTRRVALGAPLWLALTPLAVVLVPRVLGSLAALALLAPLASDARRAPARRAHVLPPPQALTRLYVQLPQVQVLLKRVGGPLVELALPPRLGFGLLLQMVLEDLNMPRPLQTPRVPRRGLAFFAGAASRSFRCLRFLLELHQDPPAADARPS